MKVFSLVKKLGAGVCLAAALSLSVPLFADETPHSPLPPVAPAVEHTEQADRIEPAPAAAPDTVPDAVPDAALQQAQPETEDSLLDDLLGKLWASDSQKVADPLESYNRWMFEFNKRLDSQALLPIAEKYREHTPAFVKTGVRNFFSNLGDIGVLTNSALQGKFDPAMTDSSRLAINTIAGLGGVIDVASMLDLEKNNEDFGQTFGFWGVPEGPFIVLPVLGPHTLRSAAGTALDTWLQVETLGAISEAGTGSEMVTEMMSLNLINKREALLGTTALLDEAALDPYIFARDAYLAHRRCLVEDCDKIDYQPPPPSADSNTAQSTGNALNDQPEPDIIDLLDEIE